ncbi:hypothetical protein [Desertivirga xinjiangensis]|uniref:hypothetical protein n=1 Tax=Desertivirga xinjiangensis TaxID=539206 RepID=UPI0021090697|nr:hypothetical protein [Pedobacter xinjiangensis]
MFQGLIAFIVIGAIIGLITKGSKGAGEGAIGGFATFVAIASSLAIPIIVVLLFIKACS